MVKHFSILTAFMLVQIKRQNKSGRNDRMQPCFSTLFPNGSAFENFLSMFKQRGQAAVLQTKQCAHFHDGCILNVSASVNLQKKKMTVAIIVESLVNLLNWKL